ncbi:hypothetical protein [Bacillus safensis]
MLVAESFHFGLCIERANGILL